MRTKSNLTTDELLKLYYLLEVQPGASLDEIKESFRTLSKIWHPDRQLAGSKEYLMALEKQKQMNEAHDKLKRAFAEGKQLKKGTTTSQNVNASQASVSPHTLVFNMMLQADKFEKDGIAKSVRGPSMTLAEHLSARADYKNALKMLKAAKMMCEQHPDQFPRAYVRKIRKAIKQLRARSSD